MNLQESIGRGFFKECWHEWNAGAATCHGIVLMLSKVERRNDTIFRISSCYPTYNHVDKQELIKKTAEYKKQQMAK